MASSSSQRPSDPVYYIEDCGIFTDKGIQVCYGLRILQSYTLSTSSSGTTTALRLFWRSFLWPHPHCDSPSHKLPKCQRGCQASHAQSSPSFATTAFDLHSSSQCVSQLAIKRLTVLELMWNLSVMTLHPILSKVILVLRKVT